MKPTPFPERPTAADPLPPEALGPMLETARALQRASLAGTTPPLLKGRILAVLCAADDDSTDDVALIDRAATELGARVAHIRPHLTERSDPHTVELTAQMLGRLYSTVVCQDVAPALMRRLSEIAGIPVHGGLDAPGHAVSRVAGMLGGSVDDRKLALQALLLRSVA
jgi:ornithine carbamoyltransferase